jgi:uncharacterized LabA/DUF88 family protein
VGMAVDAIKMAHKVDAIILATGDGDFIPLVEYVKSQGCQVEVITFGRSASGKLREVVDDFIDLDENPSEFLIGYKGAKPKSQKRSKSASPLRLSINKVVGTDTDEL